MRDYSKVSPKFWTERMGKQIRAKGRDAQMLALYLLTSPHANMLGLYHCPIAYITCDTGLSLQETSEALASLIEVGFCRYDLTTEIVWVCEMAASQINETLKRGDKRILGIRNALHELPENPFISAFVDRYRDAFHLHGVVVPAPIGAECLGSPSIAPCKPGAGTEEEEEEDKEEEKPPTPAALPPALADARPNKKGGKRPLPSDFAVTHEVRLHGNRLGYTDAEIDASLSYFVDYCRSKGGSPYADYDAAFRNCLKADWGGVIQRIRTRARKGSRLETANANEAYGEL
jgi:hypothetical protein